MSITDRDAAEYLSAQSIEMAAIVKAAGLEAMAYLFEMAAEEEQRLQTPPPVDSARRAKQSNRLRRRAAENLVASAP
jgi:hypothetical protein